jgi:hypothetical protein
LAKHPLKQHGKTEKPNQVQRFKATTGKESNRRMLQSSRMCDEGKRFKTTSYTPTEKQPFRT